MARQFVVSINNTTGATLPYAVNNHASPVNMGVVVYMVGGTGMYSVQHTFDNLFEQDSAGRPRYATVTAFVSAARWINHPTLSSLTSTADSNYAYGPNFVRLAVVSAAGGANFEMRLNQSGIAGN